MSISIKSVVTFYASLNSKQGEKLVCIGYCSGKFVKKQQHYYMNIQCDTQCHDMAKKYINNLYKSKMIDIAES